jgi:biotin-dependent carboxylase-like uncharacterized protein
VTVALRILTVGKGVTLQDAGRFGYLRSGVSWAGPMDGLAHATANRSVGASPTAAAVEISVGGIEATVEGGPLVVGLAGGAFDIRLDGRKLPSSVVLCLEPTSILSVRPGASGAWCYLAVAGRIDAPPTMGSSATHTRTGLGGIEGRELRANDVLPITDPVGKSSMFEVDTPHLKRSGCIRVVLGPQDDYFTPDQIESFLTRSWSVSNRSDRMGYFLEGDRLSHAGSFNIVSDGIAMGAIQVPGDGRPIVLMADRPPTGGYPKIATVIGADLGALAQMRPGTSFNFAAVTISEAVDARRAQHAFLQRPLLRRRIVRTEFSSEFLLSQDLIGSIAEDGQ